MPFIPALACAATLLCASVHATEQDTHNQLEHIFMRNMLDLSKHTAVKLSTNMTVLKGKSQPVLVSWSGVDDPGFDDWVAVLAPPHHDVSSRAPVKYKLASMSTSHIPSGEGEATFILENIRTDMQIGFFRNGFSNPHLVALSDVITIADPDRPAHARLTLTGDPTEMLSQWTTGTSKGGSVKWGLQSGKYTNSAEARDMTYTRDFMCGGPAKHEGWIAPGTFHRALMTCLHPFTRYYYIFGSEETGWSKEFSFLSAPEVGPDVEVKILAIADMGQSEVDGSNEQSETRPSLNTTALLIADSHRDDYSMVLHHGDISYARGYVTQWDRFHEQVEELAGRMPYMTSLGNHERDWPESGAWMHGFDSGGECGVPAERRFLMPSTKQDTPWFSFDYGPIHFIHYSTEQHVGEGSDQYEFIKRDLEAVDRSRTPWIVLGGHRPIYIDSTYDNGFDSDQTVAEALRTSLEDLLLEHHVDVTLQGHHHSYQRTCPVYKRECQGYDSENVPQAPIHLVIGNAGAGLCLNVHRHRPKIFEKIHLWWGYARLHATGTKLSWQFVSDLDGSVIDELVVEKPPGWGERWNDKKGIRPVLKRERPAWWWEADVVGPPPQSAAFRQQDQWQTNDSLFGRYSLPYIWTAGQQQFTSSKLRSQDARTQ